MASALEARIAERSQEIRNYPTPIARCDEQLAALIEERARLMNILRRRNAPGACSPMNTWINDGGFHAA